MTIWAFISDVHGNLAALERALAACRERGARHFAYLGDLLGPGAPDECVRLVRKTALLSVVGNRDLDWAARVSVESAEYVTGLQRVQLASNFAIAHGDRRLTPDLSTSDAASGFSRAYKWLLRHERRVLFFGHSHFARTWLKAGPDSPPRLLAGASHSLAGGSSDVFLVNIGTTGLPFPGKGPPACAVYDDAALTLEHLWLGPPRGKLPVVEP